MVQPNLLIAYYSRKGSNYANGKIVDLAVGNTEIVAQKIQQRLGGDLFHIETVTPYPKDYKETTIQARKELRANARPALTAQVEHMEDYSTILLGYPNWCGTMPMAVFTFLDSYTFSGKTILPFCTHEGSGMGGEKDIQKCCPHARMLAGLAIRGSLVNQSDADIDAWLTRAGLLQPRS